MCKITKEDKKEFIGQVIDVFEDFLDEKGIVIPNEERDTNQKVLLIFMEMIMTV